MAVTLFHFFLLLHIATGTVGLCAGTINIIRKKGDRFHRITGIFFYFSMLTVALSSLILALLHPNYFLFIVGIFTFYMVATGQRYLSLRNLPLQQKARLIDWALTIFMLLFGFLFIVIGILFLVKSKTFGVVLMVFGLVGLQMVKTDIKNYTKENNNKNFWLLCHIERMTGAYIAALTAFLVVNNTLLPDYVAWLSPTVLVVPLMIKWKKKYKNSNTTI